MIISVLALLVSAAFRLSEIPPLPQSLALIGFLHLATGREVSMYVFLRIQVAPPN
jgi:hypothetical protein